MTKKFFEILISILIFLFVINYFFYKTPPINEFAKTCLVTGASSGIGKAITKEMIKRGWKVIGVSRNIEKLEKLGKKLGDNFVSYKCDVSDLEQIHKVSDEIKSKDLQPTLFFLNAGTGDIETKDKFSTNAHQKIFDTNYFGTIAWIENWLDFVKNHGGGTFVATSSVMALFATPGSAAYSASKAAINRCFQSLRLQYFKDDIGFIVALPGPVDTPMLKGIGRDLPFMQTPKECAKYIVDQVFKRNKQIEPAWFYSAVLRIFNLLPDELLTKFFD